VPCPVLSKTGGIQHENSLRILAPKGSIPKVVLRRVNSNAVILNFAIGPFAGGLVHRPGTETEACKARPVHGGCRDVDGKDCRSTRQCGAQKRKLALAKVDRFDAPAGKGATGRVDGKSVAIGNPAWLGSLGIDTQPLTEKTAQLRADGATVVHVAIDGRLAGLVAIADPVKATVSCSVTCANRSPALPQMSCTAPRGRMFASIIERNTASVRKLVAVAGFTMHGTPASSAGANFSIIPHTGKLKALM